MSNWTQSAHSSLCRWLNIRLKRRGPVAQDRPNTVAVEDQEGLKRAMFYGDWNPVRVGLCSHPSEYPFSSHRLYAFGVPIYAYGFAPHSSGGHCGNGASRTWMPMYSRSLGSQAELYNHQSSCCSH